MIDQVGEGNRLTIGEGVETTLAALQLGLSYKAATQGHLCVWRQCSARTRREAVTAAAKVTADRIIAPTSKLPRKRQGAQVENSASPRSFSLTRVVLRTSLVKKRG